MEESQPNQRITPASDQKKKAGVALLISALTFGVICFFWVFLKENSRRAPSISAQSTFSDNSDKEHIRKKGKVLRRFTHTTSPIIPDIEIELPNQLEIETEISQVANEMGRNEVDISPAKKGISIFTTLAITSLGSRYPLDSLEINMAINGRQLETAYQGGGTYRISLTASDSLMYRKRKLAIIQKDGLELKRSYVKLGMNNSVFLE